MTLESISKCPVCSSTSFQPFLTCKDFTTTGEHFNIIKCSSCSFLITSPRPPQSEIGKYYQSDNYISHTGGSKNLFDRIYLLARSYSITRKRKLIESFASKGSLLDYGTGTGEFLNHCSKNDWNCEGVEPSDEARTKAKNISQLTVYQTINEIQGNKYDAVTLWHVLEHIHDLNKTLTDLVGRLNEHGVLFIAIPNPESYDAKKYNEHWAAYDVPRHLWHFNKESITNLLKQNGLTLVDIKPMKLDSFYVSLLSEGYKDPTLSKLIQLIRAFSTGLLSNWKGKREMNFSSLIYIAKR
ncbi:MAG TPA: class I SAM-dependent methyltransferase [Cyclobacteriaceae bacterium]